LTSTSVNSVSMKSYIMNIKSDSSHVFIAHGSFFSGPLESGLHWIFNFI
jgi:hypothetical protein